MSEFEELFTIQKELQIFLKSGVYDPNLQIEEKEKITKDTITHLFGEVFEVLNTINWKMHKKTRKEINKKDILEETIDVFKFLMNIWIIWGFEPEDIYKAFREKTDINYERARAKY